MVMASNYLTKNIIMDVEIRNVNTRGHDMNLFTPFPKNYIEVFYSGANNWNILPSSTKEMTDIGISICILKRSIHSE